MTVPDSAASLPPTVQLREFEGPLDLLLDEVRRQNVAIEEIAMAPVVARFLEYVGSAGRRSLNLDIEWLHMAATLIHWKSQALLPTAGEPQPDPIRDDLVRQLLAHRKQAAGDLARRQAVEETRFSRAASVPALEETAGPAFVSVWDLIRQARELARWVEQRREHRRRFEPFGVEQDDDTVAGMMEYLRNRLVAGGGTLEALALLECQPTVSRRSCLFLGMLELARDRQVTIEQHVAFGPICLTAAFTPVGD